MNGLMVEILDGHISEHVMDPGSKPSLAQTEAARELVDVIKAYLK